MQNRTKALIAVGAAMAGVAAFAGSIDRGSLARTWKPLARPGHHGDDALASDLSFLRSAVRSHEIGGTKEQWRAFNHVLDAADVDDIDQLTLATCESLARFDNAATTPILTLAHRIGVRFGWVADALVVVRARPALASLLGQRVVRIAGADPISTWQQFGRFVGGGTPAWVRNRSAWFFTVPEALSQIGLRVGDGVLLETEDLHGKADSTLLEPETDLQPGGPLVDFHDRFPGEASGETSGWASLFDQDGELPIYLRDTQDELFWVELDRTGTPIERPALGQQDEQADAEPSDPIAPGALYIRLLSDTNGGDPPESLIEDLVDEVRTGEWTRFVVDVRYHSGGDYRTTLPLVRAISERARELGVPIKVLIGPNTVGGGLISASQYLARAGERTILIGREVADGLRVRGQGRLVQLPNSGLVVHLCHDWHDLRSDTTLWNDVWLPDKFLLHGVGEFAPHVSVQNSWADFLAGRDKVLAAALE